VFALPSHPPSYHAITPDPAPAPTPPRPSSPQTEYEILDNAHGDGILKIAVSDYYPEGPTLYVIPGAWCDSSGASASSRNNGLRPRAYRRRALAEAAPKGPPSVTVNGGATCFLTGEDAVTYRVADGEEMLAERVGGGAYKIALPNNMPDVRPPGGGGAGGPEAGDVRTACGMGLELC
jgi:hypothetical protein